MDNKKIVFMRSDRKFLILNDNFKNTWTNDIFKATDFNNMMIKEAYDLVGEDSGEFFIINVVLNGKLATIDRKGFLKG